MNKVISPGKQPGWSLIELGVAMTITGLIAVMLWQVVPSPKVWEPLTAGHNDDLIRARNALLGHLHAHHRLPYADLAENGTGYAVDSNKSGRLPVRNLGLPASIQLDYDVDEVLAEPARIRYVTPALPTLPDEWPSTATTNPSAEYSGITWSPANAVRPVSGLDTCSALVTAQRNPSLTTSGIPTAFRLKKIPTAASASDSTPANTVTVSNIVETDAMAMGAGEISQILRCPYYVGMTAGKILGTRAYAEMTSLLAEQSRYRARTTQTSRAELQAEETDLVLTSASLVSTLADLVYQVYMFSTTYANPEAKHKAIKLVLHTGNVIANLMILGRTSKILYDIVNVNMPKQKVAIRSSDLNAANATARAHHAWELVKSSRNDTVYHLHKGLLP